MGISVGNKSYRKMKILLKHVLRGQVKVDLKTHFALRYHVKEQVQFRYRTLANKWQSLDIFKNIMRTDKPDAGSSDYRTISSEIQVRQQELFE